MKQFLLSFFAITILTIACNTKKKCAKTNANVDENMAFIVKFISKGQGIDANSLIAFEKSITQYNKKNKTPLTYTNEKKGREGESQYLFKYIDNPCLAAYASHIKRTFMQKELVRIKDSVSIKQQ
ncbi:MAG: hypothetical protein R2831_09735 [Chitinophagaceae bacterium]